jgi:pantoate--beta-alanine ligase
MLIVRSIPELRAAVAAARAGGKQVGLVPTMGCLHEGHLSLVDLSRSRAPFTVVSIFVNPAQFGPAEDFSKYPRTLEEDRRLCEGRGVDVLFAPGADFYAPGHSTWVEEEAVSRGLCGEHRPGHFRGVATVVLKLLNACGCDVATFGRKDLQQLAVIRRMVRDLDLPVEILEAPVSREPDGLARSSRNRLLSPAERAAAAAIPRALQAGSDLAHAGSRGREDVLAAARAVIAAEPGLRLQYLELAAAEDLRPAPVAEPGKSVLLVAAFAGSTRLIDNLAV